MGLSKKRWIPPAQKAAYQRAIEAMKKQREEDKELAEKLKKAKALPEGFEADPEPVKKKPKKEKKEKMPKKPPKVDGDIGGFKVYKKSGKMVKMKSVEELAKEIDLPDAEGRQVNPKHFIEGKREVVLGKRPINSLTNMGHGEKIAFDGYNSVNWDEKKQEWVVRGEPPAPNEFCSGGWMPGHQGTEYKKGGVDSPPRMTKEEGFAHAVKLGKKRAIEIQEERERIKPITKEEMQQLSVDEITVLKAAAKVEAIIRHAREDKAFFIQKFVRIEDKDAPDPMVLFRLWPKQKEALEAFEKHKLTIVLKARQLGLSWLALAFAVHGLVFQPGYSVVALSKREDEAKELVRRVKLILEYLPPFIIRKKDKNLPENYRGPTWDATTTYVSVYHPDSKVPAMFTSFTSSPDSARSFTASLVILDEWAFQMYAQEIWAAAYPVINRPTGGKVIGISTAKIGSFFEDVWRGAMKGTNKFHPVFLPWYSDPRRTQQWYEDSKAALPASYLQEYPCVAKGTLVGTDYGLIPIEEVEPGMKTALGVVKARLDKGEKQVVEVLTAAKRRLIVTPEHRISTPTGYIEAQCLGEQDKVCLQVPQVALEPYVAKWSTSPVCQCSIEVTQEIGRFLGYFMGDGSFMTTINNGSTVDFACDIRDQDVVEDIATLCSDISDLNVSRRVTGSKGGCCNLRSNGNEWFKILWHLGALKQHENKGRYVRNVCVPECIKRSPRPVIAEFLKGLFEADGCVYEYATNIQLFSRYEEFLRDVQLLLFVFGIHSSIQTQDKKHPDGHTYIGRVLKIPKMDAQKFVQEIGFLSARKKAKCEGKIAAQRRLKGVADFTDKVASVTPCGTTEVYDLVIEGEHHAFDANGILVHNCSPDEAFSSGSATAFPEFNPELHVCEPFRIPEHWRRWISVDNGYDHPFAWLWYAVDEDGNVYVYREFSRSRDDPKILYSDQATSVVEFNSAASLDDNGNLTVGQEYLDFCVAGLDAWNTHHRDITGKTLIDYYRDGGLQIGFRRAIVDRRLRKAVVHEYLKTIEDEDGTRRSKLKIFNTCKHLLETLPKLPKDNHDPEKVADCSIDNQYDSLSYGLVAYHVDKSIGLTAETPMIRAHKDAIARRNTRKIRARAYR